MSSGLRISTENGPKIGSLRAARNSSAAFFCASSYFSGASGGIRSCARAAVSTDRPSISAPAPNRKVVEEKIGATTPTLVSHQRRDKPKLLDQRCLSYDEPYIGCWASAIR